MKSTTNFVAIDLWASSGRLVVGCCVAGELAFVEAAGAPARTALPSVALTHPESSVSATSHAAPEIGQIDLDGMSVT